MTVPLFSLWTDKWEVKQGRFILSEMKEIRTFSAPELDRAWRGINPAKLPACCSLHLFKKGIQPVYEDPRNSGGGHFKLVAVNDATAEELWATISHLFVAGMFPKPEGVNGVTYLKKRNGKGIKIWVNNSTNKDWLSHVKHFLQSVPCSKNGSFKFCSHKHILQTLKKQRAAASREPVCEFQPAFRTVGSGKTRNRQAPYVPVPITDAVARPGSPDEDNSSDTGSIGNSSSSSVLQANAHRPAAVRDPACSSQTSDQWRESALQEHPFCCSVGGYSEWGEQPKLLPRAAQEVRANSYTSPLARIRAKLPNHVHAGPTPVAAMMDFLATPGAPGNRMRLAEGW
jgi:hypothetical protein|eukprot:CAMPEP_0174294536 /NCGR_PEP_ID=MMETSP0809-20121228/41926_1 /TAXON_ID=73025 ORGANISM="Eutreptiella gymnastica-like, Strain CCMP1594" /NCGR_SAMPLE_ID=MMETSP0809 /ASSEMBLY_ACC=CAM_ASM_000658 /LENGTH=341 /DNA_ID=CAMNT_0015396067 /DNA_START=22 /DNA_END=1047 /DNA_ORIENTATION=-